MDLWQVQADEIKVNPLEIFEERILDLLGQEKRQFGMLPTTRRTWEPRRSSRRNWTFASQT
jgi:hypothetical protein